MVIKNLSYIRYDMVWPLRPPYIYPFVCGLFNFVVFYRVYVWSPTWSRQFPQFSLRSRWYARAQVAAAWVTRWCTHARTGVVTLCSVRFAGGDSAPSAQARAAILKVTPSFGQRPCSCQEPWLKMTDSVVVEGYARLRDGKKVDSLAKFAGRTTFLLLTVWLNFLFVPTVES